MLTWIILSWLTISWMMLTIKQEEFFCEANESVYERTYWEKYKDRLDNLNIKWYCRWCMWKNWYYDCSSFISVYLIENKVLKKRLNSSILANYWIRVSRTQAKLGDLVIMMHAWTWSNHTAMYIWSEPGWIRIYDTYRDITVIEERLIPYSMDEYQIIFIWNPIEYGFKKLFYTTYKTFTFT